ncbi:cAMP-specific 3',5'-cyclic phosphodiesterase [Seminavis robusta]|uniref:cAMP-specific 3',5'-cyclic phosphodiesterase n=1 Tax=Seminavis robusta TaxID=568900 RepID=A0A9N8ELI1_9STRA|nr:cAMP-specific 3',5'-cyclic phosphodiesterase [Seminavis robusta]|eukprot:Sro1178_g249500.1 cAMP-specific 3',5'-cyclic phosphodiesterase (603) ;mRNA; f:15925-17858
MDSKPPYAAMALAITSQDWTALGMDDDPSVAPSSDLELTAERMVSLLLIRIVAIHAPKGRYQDLSTTAICRTSLMDGQSEWPHPVNDTVIQELRQYVRKMLKDYRDVPYHNREHAYHVTISVNKLLDLALNSEIHALSKTKPRMFGLRTDTLMHLLLIFSALIHDVEHQGIPNRQLALEDDELAILYNDQSIAENRSLTVGFRELLQKQYTNLRNAIFSNDEDYRRFRKVSTQLVLQTDLASPERTQIRKSKWKEAFGEDFQTMEAKVKHELKRRSSTAPCHSVLSSPESRRMSADTILSELEQLPELGDSLTNTPEGSEHDDSAAEVMGIEQDDDSHSTHGATAAKLFPGMFSKKGGGGRSRSNSNSSLSEMRKGSTAATTSGTSLKDMRSAIRTSSMPKMPGQTDAELGYSDNFRKFQRRVSQAAGHQRRFRLGIQRSIDLSGEFLETYSRRSTLSTVAAMQALELDQEEEEEEYDDLRASVIMEQILTAADIAHVFQGWHQMEKFSNRLFLELKRAHKDGRGPHPKAGWFENQIAFLESYNLPLAHRLEDMGIFGPLIGPVFARLVEANRDQWMVDGQKVTDDIIAKGIELYPVEGDNK